MSDYLGPTVGACDKQKNERQDSHRIVGGSDLLC